MRKRILQIKRANSTKAERRFMELLKKLHIPFQAKVRIKGREVDFLIGNNAIDIDGHGQDVAKNKMLILAGYNSIHLNNNEINDDLIFWLKKL